MKVCRKCQRALPPEFFYRQGGRCRQCVQEVRREYLVKKPLCSKCGKNLHALNTMYCRPCLNKIAAVRRKKDAGKWYKRLTPEQKEKRRRRGAVQSMVARGKLIPKPCEVCGSLKVEAHHYNGYAKESAYDLRWLCKEHHGALERWERKKLTERLLQRRGLLLAPNQPQPPTV